MSAPLDPAIADLLARLAAPDPAERAAAAEALCQAGEEASPAATALVGACAEEDESVREWIVSALEGLGAPPQDAIAPLTTLADSPRPLVAYWAITLLGRAGPAAGTAVDALVGRLAAGSPDEVRQRAAWALGKVGPAAASAGPALAVAARDADPRLARLAAEALAAVGA